MFNDERPGENSIIILTHLFKPNNIRVLQWSMINYLALDIFIYLHMIMKYIYKKTKGMTIECSDNWLPSIYERTRKCTKGERLKNTHVFAWTMHIGII